MRVIAMRLTCPHCSTEYDIPDTALAAGRRLRCERCGHQWRQEAAESAVPEPAAPEPQAFVPPEAPSRPDHVTTENLPKFLTKRDHAARGDEPAPPERRRSIGAESQPRSAPRLRWWIVLLVVLLLLIIAGLFARHSI
ncbi:zinc-ribbon domain-containing protein [Acidocella sp.]|jgi:predicted Zn finger-like uncharacterized protein|uniref:zinc-ribbon domain-containing protein n=1 Tax=Acidocella sp. TaxID=50710 RepID=UPI002F416650